MAATLDRIDELLKVLGVSQTQDDLIRNTSDSFPLACAEIFSSVERTTNNAEALRELLQLLPEAAPVKELLVNLLLQMDTFKEDAVYFALLPPIAACIRRLPTKRHLSLSTAMITAGAHLDTVVIPEESTDCVELLPEGDNDVERRVAAVASALLDFVQPFAGEVSWRSCGARTDRVDGFDRQVADVTRCLIKILGGALMHASLSSRQVSGAGKQQTACGLCAERCVRLLLKIHPDVVKLLSCAAEENEANERRRRDAILCRQRAAAAGDREQQPEGDDDDELETLLNNEGMVSNSGLSMLAFMVFSERVGIECVPQVYRHQYLMTFALCHVRQLLSDSRSATVMKGIFLGSSLLGSIDVRSLESHVLEMDDMMQVIRCIVRAMVGSRVKEVCLSAIRLLAALLKAFSRDGRCRLLEFLLSGTAHQNVRGHAVVLIKDEIDELLRERVCSAADGTIKSMLHRLQRPIFSVPPDGFRAKLLTDERERVMAALNLLRYLLIRDSPVENCTGIWSIVDTVVSAFLRHVRDGVTLARGDVLAEIRLLESEQIDETCAGKKRECNVCLNVGNQSFDDLNKEQRMEMMNVGLINLDMVESVLIRVEELLIINQKRCEDDVPTQRNSANNAESDSSL